MRVAVIEDSAFREHLGRWLEVTGYDYVLADQVTEEMLDPAWWADVSDAIIDRTLPGVGGEDLVRWLAVNAPHVNRLMSTASDREDVADDVVELVAVVMVKPWPVSGLTAALDAPVHLPRYRGSVSDEARPAPGTTFTGRVLVFLTVTHMLFAGGTGFINSLIPVLRPAWTLWFLAAAIACGIYRTRLHSRVWVALSGALTTTAYASRGVALLTSAILDPGRVQPAGLVVGLTAWTVLAVLAAILWAKGMVPLASQLRSPTDRGG
jgi:hypothetical protein